MADTTQDGAAPAETQAPVAGADPRADGWRALAQECMDAAGVRSVRNGVRLVLIHAAAALRDAAEMGERYEALKAHVAANTDAPVMAYARECQRETDLLAETARWLTDDRDEVTALYHARGREVAALRAQLRSLAPRPSAGPAAPEGCGVEPRDGGPYSLFCYDCGSWVPNTANHEMQREDAWSHSHRCAAPAAPEVPKAVRGQHRPDCGWWDDALCTKDCEGR